MNDATTRSNDPAIASKVARLEAELRRAELEAASMPRTGDDVAAMMRRVWPEPELDGHQSTINISHDDGNNIAERALSISCDGAITKGE